VSLIFQVDAVRVVHNDKLFKNNPDLEIFEKDYSDKKNIGIIGPSGKCIDQVKQPCHTVESVKLIEHEMKSVLEGLVKKLFGSKIKYRWVIKVTSVVFPTNLSIFQPGRRLLSLHTTVMGVGDPSQWKVD
jgi:hypothetical protein